MYSEYSVELTNMWSLHSVFPTKVHYKHPWKLIGIRGYPDWQQPWIKTGKEAWNNCLMRNNTNVSLVHAEPLWEDCRMYWGTRWFQQGTLDRLSRRHQTNSLVEIQAHSTKYSTIIWVASAMESLLPYIPNHFSLTPMERHKYREEWEGQLMMI